MTAFPDLAMLESALAAIQQSPVDGGVIELITCRPATGEREVLESSEINVGEGLVGDNWLARGNRKRADGTADPEAQLTLMNSRSIAAIAGTPERWPLAGDQLYVDMDLGEANLPVGSILRVGAVRLEVSALPHLGCLKFQEHFGRDATSFVNSHEGRSLRLRGVNVRVLAGGSIRRGDRVWRENDSTAGAAA